jgi:hypothetical protein
VAECVFVLLRFDFDARQKKKAIGIRVLANIRQTETLFLLSFAEDVDMQLKFSSELR